MFDIFLILHIISGFTALLFGTIIMAIKKGGKRHVLLGRIFFWSMMVVVFSALFLALSKNNGFLLGVGIFVFYQAFAGMKSGNRKNLSPKVLDVIVLFVAFANAVFMTTTGNIVLIVFGIISFALIFQDLRIYYRIYKNKEIPHLAWLSRHIGMMVGAYIGTFTAFLVVNVQLSSNQWIVWFAPTLILVPLMRYWNRKYTKKTK